MLVMYLVVSVCSCVCVSVLSMHPILKAIFKLLPLLRLTPPMEELPWDDQRMAKVQR